MARSMEPERVRQLTLSLINHGVQSGNRFVLTAAHTEDDIAHTIDACEQSLNEIRVGGSACNPSFRITRVWAKNFRSIADSENGAC